MKFLKRMNIGAVLFALIAVFIAVYTVVSYVKLQNDEAAVKEVFSSYLNKTAEFYAADKSALADSKAYDEFVADAEKELAEYFYGEGVFKPFENNMYNAMEDMYKKAEFIKISVVDTDFDGDYCQATFYAEFYYSVDTGMVYRSEGEPCHYTVEFRRTAGGWKMDTLEET